MVVLEEGRFAWLWPVRERRMPSLDKEKGKAEAASGQGIHDAFDFLDGMEKGMAHELTSHFMTPLPANNKLWKFQVERSSNKREYRLSCMDGEFLLFGRASRDAKRVDIFSYDPKGEDAPEAGGLYDPDRPAFTLTQDKSGEWCLVQERCDTCSYKASAQHLCDCRRRHELLRVRHSSVEVGDGMNHCMDVQIPASGVSPGDHLVTKLPKWNDDVQSLVLDFQGRTIQPSAKNFQLAREQAPNRVVCQYGKLGPNTFGLDLVQPLTVAQAFGISLTTLLWI
jgi:hypothetical protein